MIFFFQIYPTQSSNVFSDNKVLMKIPQCGCEKYVYQEPTRNPKNTPVNGTCSVESFSRGPGQKIIGFTFYEPIKGGKISKANFLQKMAKTLKKVH